LIDVVAQTVTTDDKKRQRKIRMNAIVLALVAIGFFTAFIIVTASQN